MDSPDRSQHGRAHEDRWFHRIEAERRARREQARTRAALVAELRGADDAALDALLRAGLDADALPAVEWIPLVLVAWADGAVQPAERAAILHAARADGIPATHPANALLERWLAERPPAGLLDAWQAYLGAVARSDGDEALCAHESWITARAREVAEADGGWLGFGRISSDEVAVLDALADRLRAARSS